MEEANRHVLEFLKQHVDEAFFFPEVQKALKSQAISSRDVWMTSQEGEKKGLVKLGTTWPFGPGYILTWIDQDKPKERAFKEAEARIDKKKKGLEADARKAIREVTSFLPGKGLVLDVGCGGGRLSVPLAAEGRRVVGIDVSKHSLCRAREWAKKRNVLLQLVRGTAEALPFRSCFDGLVCYFVLEFASDPYKAIKECYSVLKHGGRIVFSLLSALDDHVRGSSYMRFSGGKPLTNSLLPWEAISLLEIAGFNVSKQETSQLSSVPSGVRKWLEENPQIAMCVSPVQVHCEKPTMANSRAPSSWR